MRDLHTLVGPRISYSDQADLPMSKKWREEMQVQVFKCCIVPFHTFS